jgi:hypothetical protein
MLMFSFSEGAPGTARNDGNESSQVSFGIEEMVTRHTRLTLQESFLCTGLLQ